MLMGGCLDPDSQKFYEGKNIHLSFQQKDNKITQFYHNEFKEKQTIVFNSREKRGNKLDILWVVDNSGSMGSYQDALAGNFSSFIEDFDSNNEFKMAIVTTDNSTNRAVDNDGILLLTSDTYAKNKEKFKKDFKKKIKVGTSGNHIEKGLKYSWDFLSRNWQNPHPEANLIVIYVSDEQDCSLSSPDQYKENMEDLYGGEGKVILMAITLDDRSSNGSIRHNAITCSSLLDNLGLSPCSKNSCSSYYNSGGVGECSVYNIRRCSPWNRYRQASVLTNGLFFNIDSSFDSILKRVGGYLIKTYFPLPVPFEKNIEESSIKVYPCNPLDDPSCMPRAVVWTFSNNSVVINDIDSIKDDDHIWIEYDYSRESVRIPLCFESHCFESDEIERTTLKVYKHDDNGNKEQLFECDGPLMDTCWVYNKNKTPHTIDFHTSNDMDKMEILYEIDMNHVSFSDFKLSHHFLKDKTLKVSINEEDKKRCFKDDITKDNCSWILKKGSENGEIYFYVKFKEGQVPEAGDEIEVVYKKGKFTKRSQ